jgi:DNA-binding HxlR family transcriptional regulator
MEVTHDMRVALKLQVTSACVRFLLMKKKEDNYSVFERSPCPVACTLDILGDKWTLLIIRDLFAGKKRYGEFQDSPENIPSNILANRLNRLLEHQIIFKKPYQNNPVRYEYSLTEKGKELGIILKAMVAWGEKNIAGSKAMMGAGRITKT